MKLHEKPIAIIGMASVFPEAKNIREFWNNIVQKVDCIKDVPEDRWKINDYYDADPTAPDKTYCKRGGFLPEIDFDPMEFGLPPNILEVTDVSQMIGLVVARDALLDAGYGSAEQEIRDRTGVVLGVGGGQKLFQPLSNRLQYPVWRETLLSSGVAEDDVETIIEKMKTAYVKWEENSFPGMLGNVIAGRIANRLDLGGMNCVVDAACASSMAAMKLAVSDLVAGRADMMITGGVDTDNSIFMYMSFSKTPAFTQGDLPRPFDEKSDGMMVGEGVGMVVMKRLEDAERDGDRIYAILRGIGASSDGRYKSIYAPRGEGQERALDRAYEDAGIVPESVGLIEAHGTGTAAGDLTETTTLVRFFEKNTQVKGKVALGSVKSQIGHTKAAAGIAGVIKAVLALHHKVLPATINVDNPNPKLNLADSALYINSQTRPWIRTNGPRRAGVSSFGFGGTNFHFILEEHTNDHTGGYRLHHTDETILLHAVSNDVLQARVQEVMIGLQSEEADTRWLNLLQESREAQIPVGDSRLGFVAGSTEEALELLKISEGLLQSKGDVDQWHHPKGIFYRNSAVDLQGKVVALFSGQGAQYVEMGRETALSFPQIRDSYAQIDRLFEQEDMEPVSKFVFPSPAFTEEERKAQSDMLKRTDYVQPAIGALSAGLYTMFRNAGFAPDFVAGHSFGELTALWAGGVLKDADYYKLVKARGLAMAPPPDPNFDAGTMMAVTGDVSNLETDLSGFPAVTMANINSPKQVVIAGKAQDLEDAAQSLKGKGYNVVPIEVSAAFHTAMVGHAQRPFARAISHVSFSKPDIPVYSNTTAQPYPKDRQQIRRILEEHILNPVNFREEIENIHAAGGHLFIEFGPRAILTNLVKDILGDKPHIAIALNGSRKKGSDRQLREALTQLRVLGLQLGNIDPYASDPVKPEKAGRRKGMNVKISAAAYVSDKTRKEREAALNDGFKIKGGGETIVKEVVKEVIKEVPVEVPVPAANTAPQPAPQSANSLEDALALFSQQQSEILKTHQQYLANQAEYIQTFTQLTTQQQQAASNGSLTPELAESLARSMDAFHAHQAETLQVHETYLNRQSEQTQSLLDVMRGQNTTLKTTSVVPPTPVAPPAPVVAAPSAPVEPSTPAQPPAPVEAIEVAPAAGGISLEALSDAMLDIVSEKTGYPTDMLDLEMDIEADLGIDSIKRVEILGAMREQFPDLPQLKAEELAELRTLDEIVQYMRDNSSGIGGGNGGVPAAPVATPAAPAVEQTPDPVQANPVAPTPVEPAAGGISLEALSDAMLDIVSEKTGYPTDMLDLEMDIEADLGIDSIKRVEILGAMREQFPDLPQLKAEELAELRTLDEIVQYMRDNAGSSNGTVEVAPAAQVIEQTPAPVQTTPVAPTPVEPPAAGGISLEALSDAMLDIVSEKTGYPTDMLDLDMDIEADLGIDSIKRVEILGAMREQFPDLPQLKAEELAELRTLEEIVQYMRDNAGSSDGTVEVAPAAQAIEQAPAPVEATPVAPAQAAGGISLEALSDAMLDIVSEKTGYPTDMLDLDMDIEADLGIDSIKRVEILGAMREQFPDLPQLKAEELAELRTLDEIVQYMRDNAGSSNDTVESAPVATPAAPAVEQAPAPVEATPVAPAQAAGGISLEALSDAMLDIVSEKTGYPTDMLDLDMDIEADLGIDSIKRVEILGAMREQFPDLPQLKAEELAELRTLDEIVQYMRDNAGSSNGTVAAAQAVEQAPAPAETAPIAPTPVESASGGISLDALSDAMLDIVSEKTGYPTDMLDLDMDIEADLGIDSIKRVEILGAMREQFPDLPQLKAEELAELRTLDEIVQYMRDNASGTTGGNGSGSNGAVEATPATGTSATDVQSNGHLPTLDHDIPRSAAALKYLPVPDSVDVALAAGQVCVVTDDGSGLTTEVASQLQAIGWQVVVLNFPTNVVAGQSTLPAGVSRVQLPDMSEAQLQATLENIGSIGAFIHLNPANNGLFSEQEKALVKHNFLIAKHLKASLNEAAKSGFAAFMTVIRLNGKLGVSDEADHSAIAGGLLGLAKTLNLEWSNVFCRGVDLAAGLSDSIAAQQLICELQDPNRLLVEVGFDGEERVTLVADAILM